MRRQLKGFVLAGGKSRRLGTDKVELLWSGQSMLSRTVGLARQVCDEVWISGRNPDGLQVDAPWLPDEMTGAGPMAGIMTGLKRLGSPLLVLACDLPLLDLATVERLVEGWRDRPEKAVMTTFRQAETGYVESLVAIYQPEAVPLLARSLERGLYKLSRAIPEDVRHHIPYTHDEAMPFFNLNFPADLAFLRAMGGSRPPGASLSSKLE